MSTRIKICGLTCREDIIAVNHIKPDYIGFVFAPSKRQVSVKEAEELRKELIPQIKAVGVFVNEDREEIASIVQQGIIDIVQLHGQEGEEDIQWLQNEITVPIIKAVSVKTSEDIIEAQNSLADYLLLDQGAGGTGKAFDWNKIGKCKKPFFLAGGINADNIEGALKQGAYAIDVSGGVETNGKKDVGKIEELVQLVRNETTKGLRIERVEQCQKEDLEHTVDSIYRKH